MVEYVHKLLHNPVLASRRIVLAAVDSLFATTNFSLALGNLELAVEDVLSTDTGLVQPTGRRELGLFDDFLDDGVRRERSLCDDNGGANGARRGSRSRGGDDAARRAGKNLGLSTSDLGLTNSDVALAS